MRNAYSLFVCCAFCLVCAMWGSGIVPAIIPQLVPTANKNGNSTLFQLYSGSAPTSGNCASYDANHNVVDFGAPCNGTAASVAWNNITSGTNTAMAALMGNGATLGTTGTGTIQATSITLPATNTDVATPANPSAGNTKWYTKSGALCSLNPSGTENCLGASPAPALVLIEEHTANNSAASLVFTTCFSSTYDDYQVEMVNLVPASATRINFQVSTDGGSTWDTTNYDFAGLRMAPGGSATYGSNPSSSLEITAGSNMTNTAAAAGLVATLYAKDPLNAGQHKRIHWTAGYDDGTNPIAGIGAGENSANTAANAFRIITASGNLVSGTARCYGITK